MSISRRGLGLGAVAGAVSAALPRPAHAAPAAPASLVPATGAHLGAYAWAGGAKGVSEPEALESAIGHRLAINHCFQPLDVAFPLARVTRDVAEGRIPMLSWAAGNQARLWEIRAGLHDGWIDGQAEKLAGVGAPVLLRLSWEFDLRYNNPGLFVDVWRRVHGRFARAPLVEFVWCPTWRAFRETAKAVPFYPGDTYVDWVGADGYARPKEDPAYDYRAFDLMFDEAHVFAAERGKPFIVGETGVHRADTDPVQAEWLERTRSVATSTYPSLKAFVYFHRDGGGPDNNWRVTEPPGGPAQRAFAAYASDPYFNPA
ncbi:glycoside hydrolase family 26 protein [Streptomyces sp. SBT349]|uniref:glycoside hydrolase family 26 protein n=1 Tax=Streptomyces sp. SBT349 TaxID=1580539 RepID=UPI00066BB146|nr:glycosyl hydrolase [Streptomyces sp. SBT349]